MIYEAVSFTPVSEEEKNLVFVNAVAQNKRNLNIKLKHISQHSNNLKAIASKENKLFHSQ